MKNTIRKRLSIANKPQHVTVVQTEFFLVKTRLLYGFFRLIGVYNRRVDCTRTMHDVSICHLIILCAMYVSGVSKSKYHRLCF